MFFVSRFLLSPGSFTRLLRRGAAVLCCAVLAACGQGGAGSPDAQVQARAAQLLPADAALAGKYERSCAVCHTQAAAQAPLTGDAAAWRPRLAQGMDVLLRHAQQGLGAMPAGGQCADCTPQELRALIHFMAEGQ